MKRRVHMEIWFDINAESNEADIRDHPAIDAIAELVMAYDNAHISAITHPTHGVVEHS